MLKHFEDEQIKLSADSVKNVINIQYTYNMSLFYIRWVPKKTKLLQQEKLVNEKPDRGDLIKVPNCNATYDTDRLAAIEFVRIQ